MSAEPTEGTDMTRPHPTTANEADGVRYRGGWRGALLDTDNPVSRLLVALSAHSLVHNGPLWWTCRDCRALRRDP